MDFPVLPYQSQIPTWHPFGLYTWLWRPCLAALWHSVFSSFGRRPGFAETSLLAWSHSITLPDSAHRSACAVTRLGYITPCELPRCHVAEDTSVPALPSRRPSNSPHHHHHFSLSALRGPFLTAHLATIASQLRIQSILSPVDPEVDEPSSNLSPPKRKFEEAVTAPEAAPAALRLTEPLDNQPFRSDGLFSGPEPPKGNVEDQKSPVPLGYGEAKMPLKMRPPMRSSIACMRCRRSKIKCDNDGGNSPCDPCIKGGHQCQYPEAAPPPPKRNEPPVGTRQEKETGHERKRARKVEEAPGLDQERSAAYAEEVLSYPFLTAELWDQLLNIYRLHFATELSFLHLPTLKEKINRRQGYGSESLPELNLVLLGVLTLTARFHPDLVKYVTHLSSAQGSNLRLKGSQSKADPSAASDFFAGVLSTAIGPLKTSMAMVTVERVQAFLMLALFEWSQQGPSSGPAAWMYLGIAIRMTQALKLGLDDQLTRRLGKPNRAADTGRRIRKSSSEVGIIREIRRRTMWSCLVLDRIMACGNDRVSTIPIDTVRIQLPCTEMAFDLALDVNTGFLNPEDEAANPQVNDDSVLSRFVQLLEIWARIAKYSSTGGRLRDRCHPWDQRSAFRMLREELDHYINNLPDTFTLSRQNYYRHDNHQATNMYVSLHLLISACQMVLCREYLPFLPLRCRGPAGPIGPSAVPFDQTPDGFWEHVGEAFFMAARDIIDVVEICREKLPQSSLTLFSIWLAGFAGVYAVHFPCMDTKHMMINQEDIDRRATGDLNALRSATTGAAYQALHKMAVCLQGAQTYTKYLEDIDRYYTDAETEFRHRTEQGGPISEAPGGGRLSIRLGDGGGVEEWRPHASRTSDLAMLVDEEPRASPYEGSERSMCATTDLGSPMGVSEGYSTGEHARTPRSTPTMSYTAVNSSYLVRSGSSESLALSAEHRREGASGGDHRITSRAAPIQPGSMLTLPGTETDALATGIPEFSVDQLGVVEAQRIGRMLNDLEEFAGAGTLGAGLPLSEYDG